MRQGSDERSRGRVGEKSLIIAHSMEVGRVVKEEGWGEGGDLELISNLSAANCVKGATESHQ